MTRWHLGQAVRKLEAGGVIAYPTEAVYGLGCIPEDFHAVARILVLKNRPIEKGLILVAADPEQVAPYVCYPGDDIRQKVTRSWPGPVTWLLPATELVPVWIRGAHESVAVRISNHPAVISLCRAAGPLVSTSANPSGFPPATTARKVIFYFGPVLDYCYPGPVGKPGRPTEIRDALTDRVVRI